MSKDGKAYPDGVAKGDHTEPGRNQPENIGIVSTSQKFSIMIKNDLKKNLLKQISNALNCISNKICG